jgi:hypothetical protein
MSIGATDRIAMSQHERDVLTIMRPVLDGKRSQAEAARLLQLSVRQVRRLQRNLEACGDAAVVHGLRGKPSNRKADDDLRASVLAAYRDRYADFGPTLAQEKLAQVEGLKLGRETLRRWLIEEGLWQRRRRRAPHRSRRPRRGCFGELVQMDASIHNWLEGRGACMVLLTMIDDATSRQMSRFYPEGTTQAHMDLLWRWLKKYGRPVELYTDRHSIFEAQSKGVPLPLEATQFGRALEELGIGLIRAHSPQAKGRVERSFGTAQDRWVKELRLAKAATLAEANAVLRKLLPGHNRKFAVQAAQTTDAHRELGPWHDLDAILSIQQTRTVGNDYVVSLEGRHYQLLPPALPGLRQGKVVIERRLDGTMRIRFGGAYLKYKETAGRARRGGRTQGGDEFSASAADASGEKGPAPGEEGRAGVQPSGGRSGCTPAEPYPPAGEQSHSASAPRRPAQNHPWRKPFKPQK